MPSSSSTTQNRSLHEGLRGGSVSKSHSTDSREEVQPLGMGAGGHRRNSACGGPIATLRASIRQSNFNGNTSAMLGATTAAAAGAAEDGRGRAIRRISSIEEDLESHARFEAPPHESSRSHGSDVSMRAYDASASRRQSQSNRSRERAVMRMNNERARRQTLTEYFEQLEERLFTDPGRASKVAVLEKALGVLNAVPELVQEVVQLRARVADEAKWRQELEASSCSQCHQTSASSTDRARVVDATDVAADLSVPSGQTGSSSHCTNHWPEAGYAAHNGSATNDAPSIRPSAQVYPASVGGAPKSANFDSTSASWSPTTMLSTDGQSFIASIDDLWAKGDGKAQSRRGSEISAASVDLPTAPSSTTFGTTPSTTLGSGSCISPLSPLTCITQASSPTTDRDAARSDSQDLFAGMDVMDVNEEVKRWMAHYLANLHNAPAVGAASAPTSAATREQTEFMDLS
ncbi:Myc-type, basic helix-loop-helix (bHLH) domain [Ceraceosorus bombacis]|uniref:Myc-type, basic helix-loop-helix (BHLH) domain n=1 Tax=Ceraceosorus bombacis TaxID=401625 RepID=A0A0P1BFL8_9BASI|nr:Myc-type, basic helix-loop-helix (bHLH) domain [Ceraceosorus bombacis]